MRDLTINILEVIDDFKSHLVGERMAKKIFISKQDPSDVYVLGKNILIDF